jgi:hypothetical protein
MYHDIHDLRLTSWRLGDEVLSAAMADEDGKSWRTIITHAQFRDTRSRRSINLVCRFCHTKFADAYHADRYWNVQSFQRIEVFSEESATICSLETCQMYMRESRYSILIKTNAQWILEYKYTEVLRQLGIKFMVRGGNQLTKAQSSPPWTALSLVTPQLQAAKLKIYGVMFPRRCFSLLLQSVLSSQDA